MDQDGDVGDVTCGHGLPDGSDDYLLVRLERVGGIPQGRPGVHGARSG